jgi:hypothetical protein
MYVFLVQTQVVHDLCPHTRHNVHSLYTRTLCVNNQKRKKRKGRSCFISRIGEKQRGKEKERKRKRCSCWNNRVASPVVAKRLCDDESGTNATNGRGKSTN